MKSRRALVLALAALTATALFAGCAPADAQDASPSDTAAAPIDINVATAGDTNMVDLQDRSAIPLFQESRPGSKINVVGTGAGDSGSVAILEKLAAQKAAGKEDWDIDLAIVHQSVMEDLIDQGLIEPWVAEVPNGKLVVAENAKNALGFDVEGYVAPLYQSQVAIAYNSAVVPDGFTDFGAIEKWIGENPGRFGYNGITNGASGVGFVDGWLAWKSGQSDQIFDGPYDAGIEGDWAGILRDLKALPVTITNGNNGTLDQLNRGEIDAGPVWVDMYSQWQTEGRLSPDVKVSLPEEGLPSQPMYIVIPTHGAHKAEALEYANFLISPEFQSSVIVDQMSWYPGIDADTVLPMVSEEGTEKLFGVITPEVLAKSAKPFPIVPFKADIETLYATN